MPGISFADYQSEFLQLKALEQDLKSALYAVHPYPNEIDPTHYIVLFARMEDGSIEYSLLSQDMMELRLFAQVPNDLLIHTGKLLAQVDAWTQGKADYPHSFYQFPVSTEEPQADLMSDGLQAELNEREAAAQALLAEAIKPVTPPT